MKVVLVNQTKPKFASKELQILVNKIISYLSGKKIRNAAWLKTKKEITLVFLSKKEMIKINFHFRNKDKATDILSFASEDANSIGELLLCTVVLQLQAKAQKHAFKDEMTYMLIHGILHLLGYDHELSKKEEELMFRLQDECFAFIRNRK